MLYLSVSLATYLSICVAIGFSPPWTAVMIFHQIDLSLYREQYYNTMIFINFFTVFTDFS